MKGYFLNEVPEIQMNNEIVFSIIVSAYNASRYIGEMLKSFNHQIFKNFELIFVDDGSTDDTYSIANEFLINSKLNYKLFHQNNKGVSEGRNLGMKNSSGKYLIFFDSDDFFDEYSLDVLYKSVLKNNFPDILSFNVACFKNNTVVKYKYENETMMEDRYEWLKRNGLSDIYACKRRIFIENNIFFRRGATNGEDFEVFGKCLAYAKSFEIVKDAFYYYRQHDESSSKNISKKFFHSIGCLKRLKKFYRENNYSVLYKFIDETYEPATLVHILMLLIRSQNISYDYIFNLLKNDKIRLDIKKIRLKNVGFRIFIEAKLLMISPGFFVKTIRFFNIH